MKILKSLIVLVAFSVFLSGCDKDSGNEQAISGVVLSKSSLSMFKGGMARLTLGKA